MIHNEGWNVLDIINEEIRKLGRNMIQKVDGIELGTVCLGMSFIERF